MPLRCLFVCSLMFLIASIGCSNNVPLGGTVTFSDDGTPVPKGTIAFDDGAHQARGEIDSNGHYTVGFANEADGLPAGTYKVYITGAISKEQKPGATEDNPGWFETRLIDPKYESAETSDLSVTIDATTKTKDFKVDRATGADAQPVER